MHSLLFNLADWISDDLPAFFFFLAALEPWIARSGTGEDGGWKGRMRAASAFWLRYALCVGVAVALAEAGKHFQAWPGHPSFPSGHTTLVAASATALVLQRGRRWAWFTAPMVALMGVCLVYGHWHTPDEVAAGAVLGPLVAYALWRLTERRGNSAAAGDRL